MKIRIVDGNIIDSKEDIICCIVDMHGKAKDSQSRKVHETWPENVSECLDYVSNCANPLGTMLEIRMPLQEQRYVANLFTTFSVNTLQERDICTLEKSLVSLHKFAMLKRLSVAIFVDNTEVLDIVGRVLQEVEVVIYKQF